MEQKKSIMFGTPMARQPTRQWTMSLLATLVEFSRAGIPFTIKIVWGCSDLAYARNDIIDAFMRRPQFTDLFWLDDDIGWDPKDALRVVQSDLPILGGVYRRKQPLDVGTLAAWAFAPEEHAEQTDDGAFSALGVGLGFVKMNRKVFEDIKATHDLQECPRATMVCDPEERERLKMSPTITRFCEFTHNLGEDLHLFRLARDAGHKCWFYPDIKLQHVGEYEYTGSIMEATDAWVAAGEPVKEAAE